MSRKEVGERLTSEGRVDDSGTPFLHVDMDAFFVAVELLERPELRGLPVIVGGSAEHRGVVASASYEARRYGVRSAMPVARALQLCPKAIVLPAGRADYRRYSDIVMGILGEMTPLVEPLSIDEAFLDVSGARRLIGSPLEIARRIRARVLDETGLTCSVGGGASKFIAKLASQRCKPDGLLIVPADRTLEFLHPLPVGAIWGVGEKTAAALQRYGVNTVRDLAETPVSALESWVGRASAARLHELAWGRDARTVETQRVEKSISHARTFERDLTDTAALEGETLALAEHVARRVRAGGWYAKTLSITVRFADFTSLNRSRTLAVPTDTARVIFAVMRELLAEAREARPGEAVRLVSVRAAALTADPHARDTLALWPDEDALDEASGAALALDWQTAERTADEVLARFGPGALARASLLGRGASPAQTRERASGDEPSAAGFSLRRRAADQGPRSAAG